MPEKAGVKARVGLCVPPPPSYNSRVEHSNLSTYPGIQSFLGLEKTHI